MRHSSTISFYTLGCKLNFSETSGIARLFEENGYARVDFKEGANIVVINTCSVTENADRKCRQIVKQARNLSENSFIAVIGCYAQLKPTEIASIKGVNIVLGAQEKFNLLSHVQEWEIEQYSGKVVASEIKYVKEFIPSFSLGDRTRSFLKVQDGCDYFCSFCTIPLARGRSRSNTITETIKTAQEVAATQVREVVLTGVNIGDFGKGREENFSDLVKELDQVEGVDRFRISSIEPNLLSNEIIDFVANSDRFAPHFHIPLQSGSNEILRAMRRRYHKELYTDRVERIKTQMPDACIGVDVIVGYPGETEELFLETVNFLKELDVSYLHVFSYSERNNTVAIRKSEVVPMEVRKTRSKLLQQLSEKKKRFFYEQQLNKEFTVLFEAQENNGEMYGFTENYIKIKSAYNPNWINQLKRVIPTHVNADGTMQAEILVDELVPLTA
ncbi:MAG: tRNA (N(6)-L-threonylcarbamoyladenosine(37)-C(2))-methylthiotransferase MtaB [Flavobacteriales bacterium]|nr:tRNA (N(6)-L-threonylcarbamoyladenosine(37)-C(2))-methylthiotransferase MtaB [Flavobacteriales bacterium]